MRQPPGWAKLGCEHLVCKMKRSLYSLWWSPLAWYACINLYLHHRGLICTTADSNVYYNRRPYITILLILYIDDLLITGSDIHHITALKHYLSTKFKMKDSYEKILRSSSSADSQGILLYQTDYAKSIVKNYTTSNQYLAIVPLVPTIHLRRDTKMPLTDVREYQALIALGKTLFLERLKYPLTCVMQEHKNVKIMLSCSSITQGRRHFNVSRNRIFLLVLGNFIIWWKCALTWDNSTSLASRFFHKPQLLHRQAT